MQNIAVCRIFDYFQYFSLRSRSPVTRSVNSENTKIAITFERIMYQVGFGLVDDVITVTRDQFSD